MDATDTGKASEPALRAIPFTQFLRPDGRAVKTAVYRPSAIAERAERIMALNYRFECEVLSTGLISLTVSDEDGDHAIQVCPNGPAVGAAVDRLVTEFPLPVSK